MVEQLSCIMPWKALFMDERDGRIEALPCCFGWIKDTYGPVGEASLMELWNSPNAQRIRRLIAEGRQDEICDRSCGYLRTGKFTEAAWKDKILDGPEDFVENQRLNNREISERRVTLDSKPPMIKAIPNLQCNVRCTMCFQSHFGSARHSEDFWRQIEGLLPYAQEAVFQGGEVTTDAGFRKFIRGDALRAHPNVRIGLITNGTMFDKPLRSAFANIRMQFVNISLNAASGETYHAITGADLWDRVVENVRAWVQLSRDHVFGAFPVYTSFVIMRSNFEEIPEFVRLAQSLGSLAKLQMVIGNRNGENLLGDPDLEAPFQRALDVAEKIAGPHALSELVSLRQILPKRV